MAELLLDVSGGNVEAGTRSMTSITMKPVELVAHHHVERRRGGAFFGKAAVAAVVGQAMDPGANVVIER